MGKAGSAIVSWLFACVAACSGGAGTSSGSGAGIGGGEAGDVDAVCASMCAWRTRCKRAEPDCLTACADNTSRLVGKWNASYTSATSSCFEALGCDKLEDACLGAFAGGDPAYPDVPVVEDCLARRESCATTAAFSADDCRSLAALTAAARTEADACREKPCEELRVCLRAAGAFDP